MYDELDPQMSMDEGELENKPTGEGDDTDEEEDKDEEEGDIDEEAL